MVSLPDLGIPNLSDARLIGSGGYSEVYVAHHQRLGRRVAVKIVARFDDPARLAEFERECAAMGRLSDHPNVVVPLSAGATAAGNRYLVLEHYPDGSCAELVRRFGALSSADLVDWVLQVGGALQVAHGRGVLHNDVKPDNVLVRRTPGGTRFAVTDFGLAHLMDGHTVSGATAGSLLYVAPELLDGAAPGPASDVYGLAATTCFMSSGSPPFERHSGESWISLLRRIATDPVDAAVVSGVPSPLNALVLRALAKNPLERPTLAEVLAAAAVPAPLLWTSPVLPPADPPTRSTPARTSDRANGEQFAPVVAGVDREDPAAGASSGLSPWWFVLVLVALFALSALVGTLFR